MCCILIRHMTYAKTPIFKRFLKMSNLLETWRQQSAHNIIVDTEADDNGDDADNEKLEAAMPFVIIRGNINGQIRHGISCPAYQSKKGNLSNLSSPPSTFSKSSSHFRLQCLSHHDDLRCRWHVCLWRCRRLAPKVWESWRGVNIHTRLTNASVLCPRKHSPGWQKPPTHHMTVSSKNPLRWLHDYRKQ